MRWLSVPPLTRRYPLRLQAFGQGPGIGDHLLLIAFELGLQGLWKQTALAAITCMSGPPWIPGNTWESISLA
jgi:hypothetical protein